MSGVSAARRHRVAHVHGIAIDASPGCVCAQSVVADSLMSCAGKRYGRIFFFLRAQIWLHHARGFRKRLECASSATFTDCDFRDAKPSGMDVSRARFVRSSFDGASFGVRSAQGGVCRRLDRSWMPPPLPCHARLQAHEPRLLSCAPMAFHRCRSCACACSSLAGGRICGHPH